MFQLLALQLPILSFRLLTVRKTCDHLETKLSGVDTSKLVISIDDERALVNAITSSFPDAKHVLCTRHMRQNVNQKLTDAFVDKSDRQMLLNKIFGEDGIVKANDTNQFKIDIAFFFWCLVVPRCWFLLINLVAAYCGQRESQIFGVIKFMSASIFSRKFTFLSRVKIV